MANIIDNLNILDQKLDTAKTTLANNLTAKGVPSTTADTLTAMADKVLTIPSGGGDVEITECTALNITAKSVKYNQTTTQINYVADCKGTQEGNVAQMKLFGSSISDDFGENTTQENKTITISYTFKGQTAETTIIQKWNNPNNPDILEYEFSGSQSKIKINNKEYTFTSSPVKTDLKLDLNINEFTNTDSMFYGYDSSITKLITIPSTQNVTSMSSMFFCSSLTTLDLSGWNVQNVTNMSSMFFGSSKLTTLDLSGWNAQNVTDMSSMFFEASKLTTLDLSGWKLNENVYTDAMFNNCPKLTTIYMRGCDQSTISKIEEALTQAQIRDNVTIVTV